MPVVNSTVQRTDIGAGNTYVVERHYDQDGAEVAMITWSAAAGVDIDAVVAARVSALNEQLADQEFTRIVGV